MCCNVVNKNGDKVSGSVIVAMLGVNNSCSKNEIVCHVCNGSTVGDFGQPFECETCQGSGVIHFFNCCIHEWIIVENRIVSGVKICKKCKTIQGV